MSASDKRLRRAQEQVERLVARKELPAAVNALLELPAPARADLTAVVAPALRAWLANVGKSPAWGVLHTLAARVEGEPQVLDRGAAAGETDAARWPLLIACLRAKDWGRAGRLLALLRPGLQAGSPALAETLALFIDRRGDADGATLEAAGWRPAATAQGTDPRLGYDAPARKRFAPPPPPQTAVAAELVVLTVAATQPFSAFAEAIVSYATSTSEDVGRAIRRTAAGLATRELLSCVGTGSGGRVVGPLVLLARLAERSAPDELSSDLQLALRVCLSLAVGRGIDPGVVSAVASLAATAARVSDLRSLLLGWLHGSMNVTSARPVALSIAEALLATSVALPEKERRDLWAVAFEMHGSAGGQAPPRLPAWLEAATVAQMKHAAELGPWLARLEERRRDVILAGAATGLSVDPASRLIDIVWNHADEGVRRDLARHLVDIIDRAQEQAIDALLANPSSSPKLVDKVITALDGPDDEAPPLLPQSQAILRRAPAQAFRYSPDLLGLALIELRTDDERLQLVDRYLEGRLDQIDLRLALLTALRGSGYSEKVLITMAAIAQGIPRDFAHDPAALARALVWGDRTRAPKFFRQEVARALLAELEKNPPAPPLSQMMVLAQSLAGEMLPRPRRKVAADKKPVNKAPPTKKPTTKSGKLVPQPDSSALEVGAALPPRKRRPARLSPGAGTHQQLVLPWSSQEEP